MVGEHDSFAPPPLPAETDWVRPLLSARAEALSRQRSAPGRQGERGVPAATASTTLDRLEHELGSAEHALAERDAEAVALRASLAGVAGALGGTDIGRVERAALRAARAIRGLQRRRPTG